MSFHKLMRSGTLEQTPIIGLLRELVSSQRSGVLAVRSGKFSARIGFQSGYVGYVAIEGREELNAKDALREIVQWRGGSFDMFYLQWLHPGRTKFKEADIVDLIPLLQQEEGVSCLQVA